MRASAYIKALPFLIERQQKEEMYRIYVTDCLQSVAINTAKFAGGKYFEIRYYDMAYPQKEETRTEAEIIAHVKKAWGGDGA